MCVLICCACAMTAQAQDELLKLRLDTRVDYQREYVGGEAVHENSGFKGKYFMLAADGVIDSHFSYSYRQRLNKAHSYQSFFDATDWARVIYSPDAHWAVSAGKEVVAIGGYEYDRNPVNIYAASEFWNNIACYQLGVSVAYISGGGADRFVAQYCQSPFKAFAPDMYSYNLQWQGSHGCLGTIYSVNLLEYMPGKYISYMALGHKLTFGRLALEADFMNRAAAGHVFLFRDCSVMAELSYRPTDNVNVFGKVTYDVNATQSDADRCVTAGTELTSVGGGVEYRPHKTVRLHAVYSHSFGTNANPEGAVSPRRDWMSVGVTWNVNLLSVGNPWKKTID